MAIGPRELQTLLTWPNLEHLDVSSVSIPHTIDPPMTINLPHLRLEFNHPNLNIASVCGVFKKMTNLKTLELAVDVLAYINIDDFHGDELLPLVCSILKLAVSQEKLIVVKQMYTDEKTARLNIAKKNDLNFVTEIETLELIVHFLTKTALLDKVKVFVEAELKNHCAVFVK